MPSSLPHVKNNHKRGDFYFRDVFKRNTYSSFTGTAYSDSSTLYIDEHDVPIACTSQVSKYDNGVGSFHLYTRDQADFDKGNVGHAAVSINSATTIFRSSNTHATGTFTVGARLRVGNVQTSPAYPLDVTGDVNATAAYLINGTSVLTGNTLGANVLYSSLETVGNLAQLTVQGNVVAGNISSNAITGTSLSISEDIVHKGSVLASSVAYETSTPFVYNGPGVLYENGVPFFSQSTDYGTPFLTTDVDKKVFTFTVGGNYMIQAEVQTAYPWFPEGDVYSYYVKNGDASEKYGSEQHVGSGAFSCTRPYLMSVSANDNVRFIMDSVTGNEYEVGIRSCRIHFIKLS
jgi:hypothetical protein